MTDPRSDADLLATWRAGQSAAGGELFARHASAIARFFRNKVSSPVEDLVQQTFLALLEGQHRLEDPDKTRAYLFGIAHNILRGHLRTLTRDRQLDEDVSSLADLDPSPSSAFAHKREQQLLLLALRRIPIQHQVALELYYWEGLDTPTIAEVLEISVSAMRSRMVRARELLADALTKLAKDEHELRSTLEGLDEWVAGIRARLV